LTLLLVLLRASPQGRALLKVLPQVRLRAWVQTLLLVLLLVLLQALLLRALLRVLRTEYC
jgi:hypothetical protein